MQALVRLMTDVEETARVGMSDVQGSVLCSAGFAKDERRVSAEVVDETPGFQLRRAIKIGSWENSSRFDDKTPRCQSLASLSRAH